MAEPRTRQRTLQRFPKSPRRFTSTVAHISGLAVLAVSPGLLIAAVVELITGGSATLALLLSAVVFATFGAGLWRTTKLGDLAPRTVFASVAWSWLLVSVLGALPFVLARTFAQPGLSVWVEVANAIFESVSGYTCTGSTVLTNLPDLGESDPTIGRGVLFYRQLTQWYGGMGFVQLVVAVLPALGTKALGFMGAEAPGPTADRLSPRAAETAALLWKVYVGATLLITAMYRLAGMSTFDALNHALSTAATGGFSTYNDSLGEFNSVRIEVVAIIAMLIGGSNFALHWLFFAKDRLVYFKDHEFRAYLTMIVVAGAAMTLMLYFGSDQFDFGPALRSASFQAATLGTSTGFGNAQGAGTPGDFAVWAASPLVIILLLMVVGGMSGSTAGGIKVIRARVLAAIGHRTVALSRQPHSVVPVRLGRDVVQESVVRQVSVLMMAYLAITVAGFLTITALGTDVDAALSGVIGSLGNMGPAFGDAGPTNTFQAAFSTPARLVLAFLMLAGRLELFAVLLMFAAPRRSLRRVRPHRRVR